MYVDEKILNQFSSIREVFKDQPIRRLISEDDRIDLIKRAKTEFIDCIEREKVLDYKNIITVQTKEYGSIEVIPVDTIADIELADVQPIVYAHKTINVGRRSYCSNCGKLAIMEDFCSKCGAKVKDDDAK